jgi:hypothetical protein
MPNLLDRLDEWKRRFGPPETGQLERLLEAAARYPVRDAAGLIRLHETLLFLRAYPRTPEVARRADAILFAFAERSRNCARPASTWSRSPSRPYPASPARS